MIRCSTCLLLVVILVQSKGAKVNREEAVLSEGVLAICTPLPTAQINTKCIYLLPCRPVVVAVASADDIALHRIGSRQLVLPSAANKVPRGFPYAYLLREGPRA